MRWSGLILHMINFISKRTPPVNTSTPQKFPERSLEFCYIVRTDPHNLVYAIENSGLLTINSEKSGYRVYVNFDKE